MFNVVMVLLVQKKLSTMLVVENTLVHSPDCVKGVVSATSDVVVPVAVMPIDEVVVVSDMACPSQRRLFKCASHKIQCTIQPAGDAYVEGCTVEGSFHVF